MPKAAMSMTPVDSKAIKAVGYDAPTQTLAVQFGDDDVYHFTTVPAEVYAGLLQAESVGAYFNTKVRRAYPGGLHKAAKG